VLAGERLCTPIDFQTKQGCSSTFVFERKYPVRYELPFFVGKDHGDSPIGTTVFANLLVFRNESISKKARGVLAGFAKPDSKVCDQSSMPHPPNVGRSLTAPRNADRVQSKIFADQLRTGFGQTIREALKPESDFVIQLEAVNELDIVQNPKAPLGHLDRIEMHSCDL